MQFRRGVAFAILFFFTRFLHGQVSVLTWHNDPARTGQNLAETILTPLNVGNTAVFGKLFVIPVVGKVDAQPLYVPALAIPSQGTHNVLYVVTEHDLAYAFDADTGAQLWQVTVTQSGETPSDDRGCGQVTPEIGVTATPVIDLQSGPHGTIYLIAMSKDSSGNYYQRLHALDLTTGSEEFGGPKLIAATWPGTGDEGSGGTLTFDPKQHKERAALLLANGVVYTSWSSHCDFTPYTSWVMGYSESTLAQVGVMNLTPNGAEGGLWGAGSGPASDANGSIYVMLGNGTFETTLDGNGFPSDSDYGNAFVRLQPQNGSLSVADYFAMYNTASESAGDVDLGSGGLLLMPPVTDAQGHSRNLLVGAGKDAHIYVLDRDNMGKFNANLNMIFQDLTGAVAGVWSSPAWFNGTLYYGAVGDYVKAFPFTGGSFPVSPASHSPTTFGYPGATPSISANGTANAIVWAAENTDPATLHAYDATNVSTELYNSNRASGGRDHFGTGNKFIVPTIANGKVYVGTTAGVGVFGLFCSGALSPDAQVAASGGGGTVTVTIKTGCNWTAQSNAGFVSFNGATGGTGSGSVSYTVATNAGAPRTGTLSIAGKVFTITQDGPPEFADVSPGDSFFDAIDLLFDAGVTVGCVQGNSPQTRKFCPKDNLTRAQTATVIVRAVTGELTPSLYNHAQYFQDEPSTDQYFPYVQKLTDPDITIGCSQNPRRFCPGEAVPRWQMAVFMVRARLALYGAGFSSFDVPYFGDSPVDVTGGSFPFIQRAYEEKVTAGCSQSPLLFCPDELVTREQMAAFVMRALFNQAMAVGPTAPYLAGASPNAVALTTGSQITVTITGVNTAFQNGDTVAVPSGMLTVSNVVVNSVTSMTVTLTVNGNAVAGPQALVVDTGGQDLTLPLAIKVGTY
jgi:S-layer homology domain